MNTRAKAECWARVYICTNGECDCEKFVATNRLRVFVRSGQIYSYEPECYGKTLLSKQSINE